MNSKPFSSKVHLVTKNDEDNGDDGVDNDDDDCNVKVAWLVLFVLPNEKYQRYEQLSWTVNFRDTVYIVADG